MKELIRKYIQKTHMIEQGDRLLVGVSGGADSVCLLLVLRELQQLLDVTLNVVHVEHGIRGKESHRDAVFVQDLCRSLGVPCDVRSVDVPAYRESNHIGLEEAARLLRYEAFSEKVQQLMQNGIEPEKIRVALAHHMEDNAETVLFQMLRGSGISGLRGMQPVRKTEEGFSYIRPLLCVKRSDIEDYLAQHEQKYREDCTNYDVTYARNRLRHQVFPELEQINTQAVMHINRSAEQLGQVWDFLQEQAKKAAAEITCMQQDGIHLAIDRLLEQHPAVQEEVLRQALFAAAGHQKDITSVHIAQLSELAVRQSGRKIDLPYGVTAQRVFGFLVLNRNAAALQAAPKETPRSPGDPGKTSPHRNAATLQAAPIVGIRVTENMLADLFQTGESVNICLSESEIIGLRVFPFSGDSAKIIKKSYTKWFDYDKIKNGFQIRRRCPGDYFCIDQAGHHKKLKQYLIEEKVPADKRDQLWVFSQEACILWLVGGRISENYKVTHDTTDILEVQYIIHS